MVARRPSGYACRSAAHHAILKVMPGFASLPVLVPLLAAIVILAMTKSLRGTTLIAPRNWAIAALFVCILVEVSIDCGCAQSLASKQMLRYLSGICTFAPFMALLGAKRPQDRAWQFVVLTLLCVLVGPAISAYFNTSLLQFRLPGVVCWLLWALIAFEVINFVITRMALAGFGVAAAQLVLLHSQLPGMAWLTEYEDAALVFAAIAGALVPSFLVFVIARNRLDEQHSFAAFWSDFRALFGTTWSMRVMMMFNNGAEKNNWPVRLGWFGIEPVSPSGNANDAATTEITPAMAKSLRMLFRRFVSPEWIAERWQHIASDDDNACSISPTG